MFVQSLKLKTFTPPTLLNPHPSYHMKFLTGNSTGTSITDSVNVKPTHIFPVKVTWINEPTSGLRAGRMTHIFPVKVMWINEPTSGLRAGRMTISCKACLAVSCPAVWRKQKYELQPHQINTDNLFIGIYRKLHDY